MQEAEDTLLGVLGSERDEAGLESKLHEGRIYPWSSVGLASDRCSKTVCE